MPRSPLWLLTVLYTLALPAEWVLCGQWRGAPVSATCESVTLDVLDLLLGNLLELVWASMGGHPRDCAVRRDCLGTPRCDCARSTIVEDGLIPGTCLC